MSAETHVATAGVIPQRVKGNEPGITNCSWCVPEEMAPNRRAVEACIAQAKTELRKLGVAANHYELVAIAQIRRGNHHFLKVRIKPGPGQTATAHYVKQVLGNLVLKDGELSFMASSEASKSTRKQKGTKSRTGRPRAAFAGANGQLGF
jgi:hypothetical protein